MCIRDSRSPDYKSISGSHTHTSASWIHWDGSYFNANSSNKICWLSPHFYFGHIRTYRMYHRFRTCSARRDQFPHNFRWYFSFGRCYNHYLKAGGCSNPWLIKQKGLRILHSPLVMLSNSLSRSHCFLLCVEPRENIKCDNVRYC